MFYKDKSNNVIDKVGADFLIAKGKMSAEDLTEISQEDADAIIASRVSVNKPETEYNWAKSELESSDIEIKYHERGSAFATCTKAEWVSYQEALLHYATVETVDGVDAYTLNDISDLYDYVDVDGRPVSPPNNSDEAYRLDRAKLLRDNAISSDLVSQGMSFQVRDSVDLNNIQDVIDGALFGGYLPTDTISFRLSDNSWVDVTYPQLQQVQQDYRLRKQSVYAAFKVWTETDMSEDFSI